ncbi:hypothetical protein CI1B_10020 [Bradyrhizobium ivorense]|uniref:Uncharacterized protein n=1 Tax=Bradyrhizobium ivorense TaxID=2511166 RepID=A0A508SWJ6_9BRAD|nr:hypothetical protein [Bradyrhizobium ivorense]VIO65894.1 hypothetical protein CI1B_10020 [Bradyrhizobium ivorense]
MWSRIAARIGLGAAGLFVAFTVGGRLQYWIDHGDILQYRKNYPPRLLSYGEAPFTYVFNIGCNAFTLVAALYLVWVAMGGKPWIRR